MHVGRRLILSALLLPVIATATTPASPDGRALFTNPAKGNCAACHKVPNDGAIKAESTIGPPLENIRAKFPERARLIDVIADQARFNPNTIMPPYGRHRILTAAEIDAVAAFVESL